MSEPEIAVDPSATVDSTEVAIPLPVEPESMEARKTRLLREISDLNREIEERKVSEEPASDEVPGNRRLGDWVRNMRDGELGQIIRRGPKVYVKLNRSAQDVVIEYKDHNQWLNESEHRPLTIHQVTRIAFEADQVFIRIHGRYADKRDWQALTTVQQMAWTENGPPDSLPRRRMLYQAIVDCFPDAV